MFSLDAGTPPAQVERSHSLASIPPLVVEPKQVFSLALCSIPAAPMDVSTSSEKHRFAIAPTLRHGPLVGGIGTGMAKPVREVAIEQGLQPPNVRPIELL